MVTDDILLRTLRGLEEGLTVSLIASRPLTTCDATDSTPDVLAREDWKDFDIIPVGTKGRITGVLERDSTVIRSLDGGLLVSSRCPIHDLLLDASFLEDGYRLVLYGGSIEGVVTTSDLLRLPVRVLAFTLVTHFESTMASVIAARCPDDRWMDLLPLERRQKATDLARRLKSERLDSRALEATEFSDKKEILKRLGIFSNRQSEKAGGIEKLRNQVAHARDYVHDRESLGKFIERIGRTSDMLELLTRELEVS